MGGPGWRGLAVFWAVILLVVVVGGTVLQSLGPPETVTAAAPPPAAAPAPTPPPLPEAKAVVQPAPVMPAGPTPGRSTAGPIADPDPALLEPAQAGNGAMLPRMDATGRAPMEAYARGFDRTTLRPRVGVIVAGIGAGAGSLDAIRALPDAVTLAVPANTPSPTRLLEETRIAGHEYLLALPLDQAADHALVAGATVAQTADRLDWLLSRLAGYAGVTDGPDALHGGPSTGAEPMTTVLRTLVARGLFYVEARPGVALPAVPGLWAADVDLVVDDVAVRSEIDAKLAQLEALSRKRGWALGLATTPRPVTIDRITDWANGLPAKGLVLAPASALARQQPAATVTGATK
jgi:polysaccharide deacetylase 2 family uncharacterized protein YibQ